MELSLTPTTMAALFAAMVALAAAPSVSVLTVSARSASAGFAQGAWVALGVVAGDLVFIGLAIFGLALLAQALDGWFVLVRYLGATYLLVLGIALWRRPMGSDPVAGAGAASSFGLALGVTLGDQKAVLFYLGFLPAFVDLTTLGTGDVLAILAIAMVAVGGVKLAYAYAGEHVRTRAHGGTAKALGRLAAAAMMLAGVWLFATA